MTFTPKTKKQKEIHAANNKKPIEQLEDLFVGTTKHYIDYANVRPWADKLGWHVDPARLKSFLDCFTDIEGIYFYQGTLKGNERSEKEIRRIIDLGYKLRTKPVKLIRLSIDTSSIPDDSTALIKQFIRKALLRKFDLETIEFLNGKLYELNSRGQLYIEDRKCNFDVEIAVDMLLDASSDESADTYCLWSADSDFADAVKQLLEKGKKVVIFGTAGKVSKELSELSKEKDLFIFELAKIRDYICWKEEIKTK